jgi:molybdenum cofactor cytidylyltransferase
VNLHATASGLLLCDPAQILAANLACEGVATSCLAPMTPVRAGAMVATVKTIPFALPRAELERAQPGALSVLPWRAGLSATLVQTYSLQMPEKLMARTHSVTAARLTALGIAFLEGDPVAHAVAPLAAALAGIAEPLILIAGAAATSDRRDVVPAAIVAAGGAVERVGMPVDPGNLLVLGRLGGALVIGLPGCARSPKRNGLDLILERFAAGLPVSSAIVAGMGVGGLLDEAGQPVPWGWTGP